ncbi:MAG: hypothetical protein ILP14_13275 [Oscillospiraceae bacterium]|nr:hypothetical protein [Oscillospiraceae bacterium]
MKLIKKYIAVLMAFVMTLGVCLLFGIRKTGMFIDEIYSYGLSNSYFAPYLSDLKEGVLTDQTFTSEEIDAYLTVGKNDRFAFGSVYYNQEHDVHPPLYYWIFNGVSSFFPGSVSKWIGIGINIVFYLLTLLLLCRLVFLLFGSYDNAAATVALYGVSVLGLSTVMMIRMYTLLTFFTVLLALLAAKLLRNKIGRAYWLLLMLVIFGGMLTQYYFVFYAFFLCGFIDIYLLLRRDFRSFLFFSISALLGVALLFAAFPAAWNQLFVGNGQVVGGNSVKEALLETAKYREHLDAFWQAKSKLKGVTWVFIAVLLLCIPLFGRIVRAVKENEIRFDSLLIIFPAVPAFFLVAILSPVQEHRYLYNLVPLFVLGLSFLFHITEVSAGAFRFSFLIKKAAVLLIAIAALWNAKAMPPTSLFPDAAYYDAICEEHASLPCVYMSDGFFAPVTQDLLQLRHFDSFIVTDKASSPALEQYLGNAVNFVLYIDTSEFWSSGYDPESVLREFSALGYKDQQYLYTYDYEGNGGLSETYLLQKGA